MGLAPTAHTATPILEAAGLTKSYVSRRGRVVAVDTCSFVLRRGETLGLVGESGCGKSTLARLVLHLIAPDAGHVRVAGEDFTAAPAKIRRRLRRHIQIVFQDALSSLNPRMTVGANIAEPLHFQGLATLAERRSAARELLELVGLRASDEHAYPHEFSGGQCQRIAVARALILRPDVIVFDESVSALDVSIRAQILRLILDLQQKLGLAYLFISHDLSVVKRVSDRIAVMYLGRIVEQGPAADICLHPRHPYTTALVRAILIPDPRRMRIAQLGGIAEASPAGEGCAFRPRCPEAFAACVRAPSLEPVAPAHDAACHRCSTTASAPGAASVRTPRPG